MRDGVTNRAQDQLEKNNEKKKLRCNYQAKHVPTSLINGVPKEFYFKMPPTDYIEKLNQIYISATMPTRLT